MARAQSKIGQLMYEQRLKQNQVAKLLGVTPYGEKHFPKESALKRWPNS